MTMGRAGRRVARPVHPYTDTPFAIGSLISVMPLAYGLRASRRDDRARPEPEPEPEKILASLRVAAAPVTA